MAVALQGKSRMPVASLGSQPKDMGSSPEVVLSRAIW